MRAPGRQGHHEHAALAFDARNAHRPAVQLDQLLHERKADPRSLEAASLRSLHAMKALEDVRYLRRRDPAAAVAHGQLDAIAARPEADGDLSGERELEGVRD